MEEELRNTRALGLFLIGFVCAAVIASVRVCM